MGFAFPWWGDKNGSTDPSVSDKVFKHNVACKHLCCKITYIMLSMFAGFVVAGFSHPDQPDVSGWAIYDNGSSVAAARPLLEDVTQQVGFLLSAHGLICFTHPRRYHDVCCC